MHTSMFLHFILRLEVPAQPLSVGSENTRGTIICPNNRSILFSLLIETRRVSYIYVYDACDFLDVVLVGVHTDGVALVSVFRLVSMA